MKKSLKVLILNIFLIISIYGCSHTKHKVMSNEKIKDLFITTDTIWKDTIEIEGKVTVMKGVTLTVLPGTIIKFKPANKSKDNINPEVDSHEVGNGLILEGRIKAIGEKNSMIVFTSSSSDPKPGDWGKIMFNYSKDNFMEFCRFEFALHALHIHFSTGKIKNCVFTKNFEGIRLGMSRFTIINNDIYQNVSRGINFRKSINIIKYNKITQNSTGIFLYEKNSKSIIENNNIYNNDKFNLELGEFYKEDISLVDNWWGTSEINEINEFIYDKDDDANLGKVNLKPSKKENKNVGFGN